MHAPFGLRAPLWLGKSVFSFVAVAMLAALAAAVAQQLPLDANKAQPPGTIQISRTLMPFDIAKIALADAQGFNPQDAQFLRYIFLPDDPDSFTQATNYLVNAVTSQATIIQYGYLIHPQLIRYDLRSLAPDVNDLQNLIDTWEELAFDPYFHEFVEILDVVDDSRESAVDALKVFSADLDKQNSQPETLVQARAALVKLRAALGNFAENRELHARWKEILGIEKTEAELKKFPNMEVAVLNRFIADANKQLDEEISAGKKFFDAVKDARDAVEALVKNPTPTQNAKAILLADLKLTGLQDELAKLRGFDIAALKQFVKDADKVLAAAGREKLSEKLGYDLKKLRDAVDRLAKDGGVIEKVEVKSRRSGQGALGVNEEVPIPARHAGEAFELLTELIQSDAAIVRADYFEARANASIDRGHGSGLLYQFYNVKAGLKGKTDFDQLLSDLGVSLEEIAKQRSDSNAAMFYSGVTGRTRKVIAVPSLSVAPTRGSGLVVYTQDPSDEQVAAVNEPIRNLISFTFAAQEFIYAGKNGLLRWDLFNAAGLRQNSAPDNVVTAHYIPSPYTKRLYSGGTCLICHGPQGGHMSIASDVRRLTRGGVDILDDLGSASGLDDQLDKFVGQYEGDLERPIQRARDDYGEATFRATAGIRVGKLIKTYKALPVPDLAALIGKVDADYVYTSVTARMALRELGYLVKDEHEALELLRQVAADYPSDEFGVTLLDPVISGLKLGIPIPRTQYENVYFDLALRSMLTAKLIADGEVSATKPAPAIQAPQKGGITLQKLQQRRAERLKIVTKVPKLKLAVPKPRPHADAKAATKFRAATTASEAERVPAPPPK